MPAVGASPLMSMERALGGGRGDERTALFEVTPVMSRSREGDTGPWAYIKELVHRGHGQGDESLLLEHAKLDGHHALLVNQAVVTQLARHTRVQPGGDLQDLFGHHVRLVWDHVAELRRMRRVGWSWCPRPQGADVGHITFFKFILLVLLGLSIRALRKPGAYGVRDRTF